MLLGKFAVNISEVGKNDGARVGGKGANLGELVAAGIPVPPGFVVTAEAYFGMLEASGLRPRIEEALSGLDVSDTANLNRTAEEIKALISTAQMPADVASDVTKAYEALGCRAVAVRSSATAEDLADASFAGQQETFLNIEGAADVVGTVQKCWASLFEPRAIHYRAREGFDHLEVGIAVVVQTMVQSEISGVMFTLHPVTNDRSQAVIEAVYGLGEAIVSGMVTPDSYVVEKASGGILDCQVVPQEQEMVRGAADDWQAVGWDRRAKQKLSDAQIGELAAIGSTVEAHFGCPQDIEWAWADGAFYIVQARAVTTAGEK